MQNINETSNTGTRLGLVVSYFGNSVAVEVQDGQVFQCYLRRNQELPVVGDQVRFQFENSDTGVIVDILPRKTLLSRGDRHGKMKPLAANLDILLIVMAPPPVFSEYLVDRYLIAAEILHIQPALIVNKADLLDAKSNEALENRLQAYRQVSCPVMLSSAYTPNGLEELKVFLKRKTAALVGPSGVGKSSIIARISQHDLKVGEVSAKGAGKHTTTATRLYHLPDGGRLIDSPGVREFNLWSISKEDVLKGFKEFLPYIKSCRFRDCKHTVEPGCAVQAAIADGKISAQRFKNYNELLKEIDRPNYKR